VEASPGGTEVDRKGSVSDRSRWREPDFRDNRGLWKQEELSGGKIAFKGCRRTGILQCAEEGEEGVREGAEGEHIRQSAVTYAESVSAGSPVAVNHALDY